jgi:hypothetical protein
MIASRRSNQVKQMPRFDVVVYRQVNQFIQVVVDAETEDAARQKAAAAAQAQPADHWQVENEINHGEYTFTLSVM